MMKSIAVLASMGLIATSSACWIDVVAPSAQAQTTWSPPTELRAPLARGAPDLEAVYSNAWSARQLAEGAAIIGEFGNEVADLDDLIFDSDGLIRGLLLDVGGFWIFGGSHVFVPWYMLDVRHDLSVVEVPFSQEEAENWSADGDSFMSSSETGRLRLFDDWLVTGPGLWRSSDVIGTDLDLANGDRLGTVFDLLVDGFGRLKALVLEIDEALGGGRRAIPAVALEPGWSPGVPYGRIRLSREDVAALPIFQYERLPLSLSFGR